MKTSVFCDFHYLIQWQFTLFHDVPRQVLELESQMKEHASTLLNDHATTLSEHTSLLKEHATTLEEVNDVLELFQGTIFSRDKTRKNLFDSG